MPETTYEVFTNKSNGKQQTNEWMNEWMKAFLLLGKVSQKSTKINN